MSRTHPVVNPAIIYSIMMMIVSRLHLQHAYFCTYFSTYPESSCTSSLDIGTAGASTGTCTPSLWTLSLGIIKRRRPWSIVGFESTGVEDEVSSCARVEQGGFSPLSGVEARRFPFPFKYLPQAACQILDRHTIARIFLLTHMKITITMTMIGSSITKTATTLTAIAVVKNT